jgi:cobalt-precorrin 5A hydrolase
MKTAILVLTRNGLTLARRLREAKPEGTVILGPSCVVGTCGGPSGAGPIFATSEPAVFGWLGPLRKVFPAIWAENEAIVAVMALGIVVRLIGPLASDKRRDPAVVAVDDAGRYAISVLGGHGAGANELAGFVAEVLGAQAIVTTASESRGLPAVDRIGREFGWKIERAENLTRVAAAVVRGETVAIWQDAGSLDWWQPFGSWPESFVRIRDWSEADRASALIVISDRVEPHDLPGDRTLVYRPPTLVAGIGCRRGVPFERLDAWVEQVFADHGLASKSLAALATVSLKADEPGLLALAEARGVPLLIFSPDELAGQPGIERPSERVRARIGISGVAEPAALRASGASRLLVPKQIGPGMTLAVARRPDDHDHDDDQWPIMTGDGPKAGA